MIKRSENHEAMIESQKPYFCWSEYGLGYYLINGTSSLYDYLDVLNKKPWVIKLRGASKNEIQKVEGDIGECCENCVFVNDNNMCLKSKCIERGADGEFIDYYFIEEKGEEDGPVKDK
jgi:hypothetical protein